MRSSREEEEEGHDDYNMDMSRKKGGDDTNTWNMSVHSRGRRYDAMRCDAMTT